MIVWRKRSLRISLAYVVCPEQWRAQIQSLISWRARVLLYSSLTPDLVEAAHWVPCSDIGAAVQRELDRPAPGVRGRVAVLPQGSLTIPYIG